MSELISMSEFARRKGVTPQSVCKAVKVGRIGVVHEKGKPKLDWEIASVQWDRSRRVRAGEEQRKPRSVPEQEEVVDNFTAEELIFDDDDEPAIPPGTIYSEQRGATEAYKAKLARLKYLEEKGQLVRAEDVKYACSKMVSAIRQRVQSVPSKAKIRLPHLTVSDMSVLDDLMREALTELADWSLKDAV
ncbi:MAG: hypothetical protein Q4C86_07625 [bacterium]|nr:hypothetical protein [bacterium]